MPSSVGRIETVCYNMHREGESLLQAANDAEVDHIRQASRAFADYAHRLTGHCNVTLVNDALRDWYRALENPSSTSPASMCVFVPSVDPFSLSMFFCPAAEFNSLSDLNAVSHLCVQAQYC